jgi:hypothetical protein
MKVFRLFWGFALVVAMGVFAFTVAPWWCPAGIYLGFLVLDAERKARRRMLRTAQGS